MQGENAGRPTRSATQGGKLQIIGNRDETFTTNAIGSKGKGKTVASKLTEDATTRRSTCHPTGEREPVSTNIASAKRELNAQSVSIHTKSDTADEKD